MGFGGLSRNCSGCGIMMSSLTLFHFSVPGGGIGFLASCFNGNLINCPL